MKAAFPVTLAFTYPPMVYRHTNSRQVKSPECLPLTGVDLGSGNRDLGVARAWGAEPTDERFLEGQAHMLLS